MTRLYCVLLGFLALGAPISAQPASTEPMQDGKPLSQWVKALADTNPETRVAAAAAIGKMHFKARAATPALLEALKDKDAKVRLEVAHALREIDLDRIEPAIPVLVELLDQEDQAAHLRAARLLGHLHAVPALTKALGSRSARTRKGAAHGLLIASHMAKAARPALIALLSDPDREVRLNVCEALVPRPHTCWAKSALRRKPRCPRSRHS